MTHDKILKLALQIGEKKRLRLDTFSGAQERLGKYGPYTAYEYRFVDEDCQFYLHDATHCEFLKAYGLGTLPLREAKEGDELEVTLVQDGKYLKCYWYPIPKSE